MPKRRQLSALLYLDGKANFLFNFYNNLLGTSQATNWPIDLPNPVFTIAGTEAKSWSIPPPAVRHRQQSAEAPSRFHVVGPMLRVYLLPSHYRRAASFQFTVLFPLSLSFSLLAPHLPDAQAAKNTAIWRLELPW